MLSGDVRNHVDWATLLDWSARLYPAFELQILSSSSSTCMPDADELAGSAALLTQTEKAMSASKAATSEKRKFDSAVRATLPPTGCGAGRGTLPQWGDIIYLLPLFWDKCHDVGALSLGHPLLFVRGDCC